MMKLVEPACVPVAIAAEKPRSVGDCEAKFYIEGKGPQFSGGQEPWAMACDI